ncbi:MAG: hypothetical protein ACOCRX_04330 [Candidatus Woesearchaeota archaeon]
MSISVEDIKEVYMNEDSSKELKDLNDNFYKSVRELLQDLYSEEDDDVEFVINKIKDYFEEIVNLRRKKILNKFLPLVLDGKEDIVFESSSKLTPEEKEYVDKMVSSSENFNKIVNNIKSAKKEKEKENSNKRGGYQSKQDTSVNEKNIENTVGVITEEKTSLVNSRGVEWENLPKNSIILYPIQDIKEEEKVMEIGDVNE